MRKTYPGLFALISADAEARSYYEQLPNYVKEQMETRAESINSLESMQDYVENLTRGDG